jgi:hypothetical protein
MWIGLSDATRDSMAKGASKMEKEIIIDNEEAGIPTLPCTPFLLTSVMKKGDERHFVIDSFKGETIETEEKNHFVQTFKWSGHIASKEEAETFLKEEDGE